MMYERLMRMHLREREILKGLISMSRECISVSADLVSERSQSLSLFCNVFLSTDLLVCSVHCMDE